jgi:hypothetical protein
MKLQQGQIWKQGEQHLRIVHLERLEVEYKSYTHLETKKGTHHQVTKKEFCKLIKGAELLPPAPAPAPEKPPAPKNPKPATKA